MPKTSCKPCSARAAHSPSTHRVVVLLDEKLAPLLKHHTNSGNLVLAAADVLMKGVLGALLVQYLA